MQQGGSLPRPGQADDQKPQVWLSILVPVYNVLPYLRDCIVPIMDQIDMEGVEVILVDDRSTDGSRELCQQICSEYAGRIRLLLHPENRGLSAARNTMIEAAAGEYLWFIDSDDEMAAGAIRRLRQILDTGSPDIVMCDYAKQGKDYASFSGVAGVLQADREALIRGIFASRRMHSWSKISRRSLWADGLRFPEGRYFEDLATTPWLFLRANSFFYAPESWIIYRVRAESITGRATRTKGFFDDAKNDDVATGLTGFARSAIENIPDIGPSTIYAIANFCGKEFTKISYRLLSARLFRERGGVLRGKLRRYRTLMEDCSPIPFSRLSREHLRRSKPGRWLILTIFLALTS